MNVKKLVLVFCLVAAVAAGTIGTAFVIITSSDQSQTKEAKKLASKPVKFDKKQIEIGGEKSDRLPKLIDGNEPQVTTVMHKMTHQKVLAREKWGAIEMTPENIKIVKEHVLANHFKSEKFFLEILSRWEAGDFTKVDKDHNDLWEAQDGNIGEAKGIMTEEQEQMFIEENFR